MNHDYQKAVDILTSQGKFYINLGLERISAILDLIGNPQNNLKFIHVAGTNGKGSVCAMLSSILCSLSPSIGLFTSPHVFEYTERIKINDIEIEKNVFAKKVIKITKLAQKNDIRLTEFEILTAVAFEYFAENNVDIAVLETGLGGRLDATNVIEKNICSIITHIDFDHTERLGETIEKIAREKAGIIKEKCPVIISDKNLGFKTIQQIAKEKNSELLIAKAGRNFPAENSALQGNYQRENLELVLTAIEFLRKKGFDVPQEAIQTGLKNVKHPCRFEYLKEENILIDGAHNPNGIRALRESLDSYFPGQNFKFIFGCLKNKNYPEMIKNLVTPKDEIYFYHFDNKNACSCEELAKACKFNSKPFSEFKKNDNILTVVCGSFYMIKELLSKMGIK
ncbi:MAG: folylpolyglutamate synthase/dihydrofolate synthase family protein [Candidatus Gastranaerophilaceae bacterium]